MKPQDLAPARPDAVVSLGAGRLVRDTAFGRRAYKLARLTELGLPVLPGIALSFDCVRDLAEGGPMPALPLDFTGGRLFAVRSSPEDRAWGGAPAIVQVGLCPATLAELSPRVGPHRALALMCGFIQSYAVAVAGLDPEDFEALGRTAGLNPDGYQALIAAKKSLYAELAGAPFPDDPMDQIEGAVRAMARSWNAASARILREARGAPPGAGLGLIVQEHALACGRGHSGSGALQTVDSRTGAPAVTGGFTPAGETSPRPLGLLEEAAPRAYEALLTSARAAALGMGEVFQFDFALCDGRLSILDAVPVRRNARASVRIAVDLANLGAITRGEALLRVDPRNLIEHLHPRSTPPPPATSSPPAWAPARRRDGPPRPHPRSRASRGGAR
jgi:pyruvate,orthophosphate dikinase